MIAGLNDFADKAQSCSRRVSAQMVGEARSDPYQT
jgi:hypothetical protein